MTRTLSVAGTFAVLLLAFWLLRIAGSTGLDAPLRVLPGAAAANAPAAPASGDPAAQAVEDLAAWPIAAVSGNRSKTARSWPWTWQRCWKACHPTCGRHGRRSASSP